MKQVVTFGSIDFQVVNGFTDGQNMESQTTDSDFGIGGYVNPPRLGVRTVTLIGLFQPTTPGEWPACETETRFREWAGSVASQSRKTTAKLYTIDGYYWDAYVKGPIGQNFFDASVTWTATFLCPEGRMYSDAEEDIYPKNNGDTVTIASSYDTPVTVEIATASGTPVTFSLDSDPSSVLTITPTTTGTIVLNLEKCTAKRAGVNAMSEINGAFPSPSFNSAMTIGLTGASGIRFKYRKALI